MKDKIMSKIEGWKENLLNQAGKEVLIKSIIQAIPTYVMSIVRFPKNFCKSLCSQVASFWWRGNRRDRGMHWKAWSTMTTNKKEGGMGFKDFNIMNSAHLAKQAWRAINNPEALWVQVLKGIYHQDKSFVHARRRRNDSWTWASIIHGKETLMKSARWLLGKGENVKIAQDPWIASGVRIDNFMHPEIEFVSSLIDQANACWNVPLLRRFFNPPLVDQILQTPFSWFGGDDKLWWPFTKTGEYSVKSGYWQIKQHQQSTT